MDRALAQAAAPESAGRDIEFLHDLDRYLRRRGNPGEDCGLIVVQLTNLGRIKTTAGYGCAHVASSGFVQRIEGILRSGDWLGLLREDRIAVVFDRVKNSGHLVLAANRIVQIASDTPIPDSDGLSLEVRIGIAMYPEHGNSAENLLQSADLALESAVASRVSYRIYTPRISKQLIDQWDLAAEIDVGLKDSEFEMFYQPKVRAGTFELYGAEALMRWNNPRRGMISPDLFIDAVDDTGQIDELSRFALHSAVRDAASWPAHVNVAVNLTPSVLESGSIAHEFESIVNIWGVAMNRLTVEITENGIVAAGGRALAALQMLRDAGVRVSIDDFGTGNSSLAYFKNIPADELKIDKSFVMDMHQSQSSSRLVRTIIELAHSFGLTVVAEGVENDAIADMLQQLDCDVLQGYFFARPLAHDAFLEYLSTGSRG